jgi:hypothetical protein
MPSPTPLGFDLLTLNDVAGLLHCSKAHVSNAVNGRLQGCSPIPTVALGRRRLVRREALLDWIVRNENAAGGTIQASPERGARKHA